MLYINTHPADLDIDKALARVSAQRRRHAMQFVKEHDRKLSLAAYLLLLEALEKEYGITEAPEFSFGPHRKPFLKDYPHIHFNLSHCSAAVLCVVSDRPVGCDIETVESPLDMDLCRYCCSPAEIDAILKAPSPPLAFYGLWTRKEAFLKLSGEGLSDNLPGLLETDEADRAVFDTRIGPDASYVYTVCSLKK